MRRNVLLALAGLLLMATSVSAQTLLEKAEQGLGGGQVPPPPAPPAATAPAAPSHGYLGFTPDEEYKLKDGVRVVAVKPGGPAEAAGLQKDDLVKLVDGKPVFTVDEMDALQKTTTPGQTWRLSVERAGKPISLNVKLSARPVVTASDTDPGEAAPGGAPPTLTPPVSPLPSLTPPATLPSLTPPATTPPATFPPATAPPATTPPAFVPGATVPGATTPVDPLLPANDPPATVPGAGGPIRSSPAVGAPEATVVPSTDTLPSPAAPAGGGGASLGITVVPLTPEAIAAYGLVVRRGALITAIRPGSPADTAGLPLGAVVVTIDGRRIDTADELVGFVRAARPGQEVELGYMQGDRTLRKTVRLGPTAVGVVPSSPTPAPGGLGLGLGGGGPLINRAERMVEGLGLGPGRGGISSVYDPSEMAMLKTRVGELTEQVKALKDRLDQLEGRAGGAAPPPPAP